MRVLVVAPKSNIDNMADWVASARGHELTVLNGTVSAREVLSCIAGGNYEVVHFATHGCPSALGMTDGELSVQLLEDAFRAAGRVELVILEACATAPLGARLYMAGVPRTVSWRVDVADNIAGEWARMFYSSLQLNHDIWEATRAAAERLQQLGAEPPIYLNGRMAVLEAHVQAMRRTNRFGGAPAWLVAGFAAQFALTMGMLLHQVLR